MTVLELIEALKKLKRAGNLEVVVARDGDVVLVTGVEQGPAPYTRTGPILDPEKDVVTIEVVGYR